MPHHRIHHLLRTLLLATEKSGIAHFFATFISNSRFFGLLFNFTTYETINLVIVNCCSVLLAPSSLTRDNLHAHCALFLVIVIFF